MAAALKSDYSYQIEENDKERELLIERIRKLIFKDGIPKRTASKQDFSGNPPQTNVWKIVKPSSQEDYTKYFG